jgi:general secretion pathway protein A
MNLPMAMIDPFESRAMPSTSRERFFPSTTHEEALARLDYLVEAGRRVGVLIGPRGSGKSLLLSLAAQRWKQQLAAVANLGASALDAEEFLWRLAGEWQNGAPANASRAALWRAVSDALAVHRSEQRASLLFVDDAGQAQYDVLDAIARLAQLGDIAQPRLTIVLATEAARASHLGGELLSRAELRVELAPLEPAETHDFVRTQFELADTASPRLDPSATTRLHELTAGLPRRLTQLAELVRLAAAADGREQIDAATVNAVYRELSAAPLARS